MCGWSEAGQSPHPQAIGRRHVKRWISEPNDRPSKLLFAASRQPGNQDGHHRT
jgi:hypothetical protein